MYLPMGFDYIKAHSSNLQKNLAAFGIIPLQIDALQSHEIIAKIIAI